MDSTIIVAIIGGGFSFLGALLACLATQSKTLYRIEQLEKKVDKHNNMVERTYQLESDIKTINVVLDEVRKDGGHNG